MIDIDKIALLKQHRRTAVVAAVFCTAAVVLGVLDIVWPSIIVLALAAIIFWVYVIAYSAEIREVELVDDKHLHKTTRRFGMK